MERAYIYGDSLLKATMPDAEMHYHFHLPEVMAQYPSDRLEVVNRAKMGATVTKGLTLVEHDVQRAWMPAGRWWLTAAMTAISTGRPSPPRRSRTTCPTRPCRSLWRSCTVRCTELKSAGVQPVLMTLPPIDSQRYFQTSSPDAATAAAHPDLAGGRGPHLPPPGAILRRGGGAGLCGGGAPSSMCGGSSCPSVICPLYRRRRHPPDHVRLSLPVRHAGRPGCGSG